jgi:hypothetical protein
MHFEIFVEDQSCGKAMGVLIPEILGNTHTYKITPYKGLGRVPQDLIPKTDGAKRLLLDQLPRVLRAIGKTAPESRVVVVCDLDDKNKSQFLAELGGLLRECDPAPNACFCLAVEEVEAWYLGDLDAIRKAYPNAKDEVLGAYVNDSICGTWERLADAVFKGGCTKLKKQGWQAVGREKSKWAIEISPHMDIDNNLSPSFNHMVRRLRGALTALTPPKPAQ